MPRFILNLDARQPKVGPVCIAIAADTPQALFAGAGAAIEDGAGFLELRLDSISQPDEALPMLAQFAAKHPDTALLATCRTRAGGGSFLSSVESQLQFLEQCARAGATLIDVELETLEAATPARLLQLRKALDRAGTAALVSAHDFAATGDLARTLASLRTLGAPLCPAIYKVVSTANCLADNLRMLRFLEQAAREVPVVGICMGVAGIPSRVLALRAGAVFTFAAADGSPGTAPGQISAKRMLEEFRAANLTPETRLYGIAGNPVTHSLSPALHNAAFRAAGIDAVYLPLHTTSVEDLWELVEGLPLDGLSVTMPWKVAVLPRLNTIDPESERLGAVNTLVRQPDGTFFGANTDLAAIVKPLEQRMPLAGARVLLLGAGGAARAAAFGLRARGAHVAILNRTPAPAEKLARESGALLADARNLRGYAAILNATPAGMLGPAQGELPADVAALEQAIEDARIVFEMVYRPPETPLTRLARDRGLTVISGLEMFLHQAAQQWQLWTGRPAPLATMRAALHTALLPEAGPLTMIEGDRNGKI